MGNRVGWAGGNRGASKGQSAHPEEDAGGALAPTRGAKLHHSERKPCQKRPPDSLGSGKDGSF